tara:strand:- start:8207 stop:9349 length:1143 start_codon:yes stop_codon:yes gene_type:complete
MDSSNILQQYEAARQMHKGLSDKFTGLKVSVTQPLAGSAYADPSEVSEDLGSRFGENARLVMATFPSYVTDLGRSIAGKARNLVRSNSARVPSTNGYLVHNSKLNSVETHLLAYKGIEDADRETHDEEMIREVEDIIRQRMESRKGIALERDLPVTFTGYVRYVDENFDRLIDEILSEYGEESDKIANHLPNRNRISKAKFRWYHYAEVPSLMMYGESSLRDILHQEEQNEERRVKTANAIRSEINKFQEVCREAVGSVQYRVRSEIATKLRDFVSKVGQNRTYNRGGEELELPRNITASSLVKLQNRIDELTAEVEDIADNDEFYRTVREFRNRLNAGVNMEDSETRSDISNAANRIIEQAFDESAIDNNTGRFYASIL